MLLRVFAPHRRNKLLDQRWTRTAEFGGKVCLDNKRQHTKVWMWHFRAANGVSSSTLEGLEERLRFDTIKWKNLPRMIVIENQHTTSVDQSLEYLREVLPVGAQLLQEHPDIGGPNFYGRCNYGGGTEDAAAGICYHFPQHNAEELAALLEAADPRLALEKRNLKGRNDLAAVQWESVVNCTDALVLTVKGGSEAWKEIWKAQKKGHCKETYAINASASNKVAANLHAAFKDWKEMERELKSQTPEALEKERIKTIQRDEYWEREKQKERAIRSEVKLWLSARRKRVQGITPSNHSTNSLDQ